jgi:hypothetical protein
MLPLKRYALAAVLCVIAACSDHSVSPVAQKLDSGTGDGSSAAAMVARFDLTVGQSMTINPRTTTRTTRLRWTTGDASVASVSTGGRVTANGVGVTTVTVTGAGVAESYNVAVAAPVPPAPTVTGFSVQPAAAVSLLPGQTQQFTVAATWSDGQQYPLSVTYTATGGSISSTGLFTAGTTAGRFAVVAVCVCGLTASAPVDVAQLTSLRISPKTVTLAPGATQAFSATALWSTGATTLPPVTYSATGGSISTNGQYTAPSTAGTYRVFVAHSAGTVLDTATVTVSGGQAPPPPPPTPTPGALGPGRNAPAWSGKTVYPEELFNTPIPVHFAGANAAGFKGWQGFDGAWGTVHRPTRVAYPVVSTPIGTKPVLQVTYPGSSKTVSSVNGVSEVWPTNQAWGVRVSGSWSGTLVFERSADGITWAPISLTGIRVGTAPVSASGSQTSVNGVWISNDALTLNGGSFRVRATSWNSGTATVVVGMQGGAAAARMSAGSFNGNPTRVYTRVLMYVDPNWTNGGNTGTKFFFFSQQQGNNHFTGVIGGSEAEGTSGTFVGLQGTSFRNMLGSGSVSNGTWLDVEFLIVANGPGLRNGVARAWINGVESQHVTDVMYFAANTVPGFSSLWMDPTYGGGSAPPPRNVFFQIAGWYRESAP